MKTFVIFERKTGKIVHTHVQTEGLRDGPKGLVKMVRPEGVEADLDVIEVAALQPGTSYRVDVKAGKLVAVDKKRAQDAGGASVQSIDGNPVEAQSLIFDVRLSREQG